MNAPVQPDRDQILAALDGVIDPRSGRGLHAAGLVQGLVIGAGRVGFMMEVPAEDAARYGYVRDAAEKALRGVPGVEKAQVVLTAAARAGATRVRKGARVADDPRTDPSAKPPPTPFEHVKRVIAVVSGKGGVGKSTVAVNLACALAAMGLKVGLLDCDVYGPSVPRMMGVDDEPVFEDGKLQPLMAFGLKLMSIGFIVDEGRAMIWRGPMVTSAVRQMIKDVRWGGPGDELDVLVADMPPGTGDIQLTLFHDFKIDGAVIVSTPQEIALIDARRAAAMLEKLGTPILGMIENMAYFPDPATGAPIPIFGQGGARAEAAKLRVPLLAEIPIDIALRRGGDEGTPLVVSDPNGAVAQAFAGAARILGDRT
ncbi:MAG TPA: Mrp/NBP35 family ATP-binding protein [Caulobacteraceae bacterium]|nr:Mrp/NBP35 family ATP-binding protein [Caulobacteraceae bacterium]